MEKKLQKKFDIRVICIDIDGTLLFKSHFLSLNNKKACIAAQQEGMLIILSTGRDVSGSLPIAQNLNMTNGYIVALNGAKIFDIAQNKVINHNYIKENNYKKIIEFLKNNNWKILSYTKEGNFSNFPTWVAKIVSKQINTVIIKSDDVESKISAYKIIASSSMAIFFPWKWKKQLKKLQEEFSDTLEIAPTHFYSIEITTKGINKGSAVNELMKTNKIKMENVAAIGNGWNDLPLLHISGLSIAMGNSISELKKIAKFITKKNSKSGVAYAINNEILKRNTPNKRIIWNTKINSTDHIDKPKQKEKKNLNIKKLYKTDKNK